SRGGARRARSHQEGQGRGRREVSSDRSAQLAARSAQRAERAPRERGFSFVMGENGRRMRKLLLLTFIVFSCAKRETPAANTSSPAKPPSTQTQTATTPA